VFKGPKVVCIVSTMRSGSTLLKSLIATAQDTSDLPEVDFSAFRSTSSWRLRVLSKAEIVVLKFPRSFRMETYPLLPRGRKLKVIFLVRDVYSTVNSLVKMIEATGVDSDGEWTKKKLANVYWTSTNQKLLDLKRDASLDIMMVKYEELVDSPIVVTGQVFKFIGSKTKLGVDTYKKPSKYSWRWGSDDGGEIIKSLKVQKRSDDEVKEHLQGDFALSQATIDLRRSLGYH